MTRKQDRIYTAYEAEPEYGPVYIKAVPNLPVPPHPADLDHDEPVTDEVEDQQYLASLKTICPVCGNVFTPWPTKMRCPDCGAGLKR